MMLSMYSGVSGLKSFQTQMDVIGNNIANVSTTGFKSSSVSFAETLTQTLKSATAPQGNRGGTNAQQVGLGVSVASVNVNQTSGNTQSTGNASDLAIKGDGFFVVNNGIQDYYTRAGSLTLDEDYNLVSSANGYIIQGWTADATGNIDSTKPINNIKIELGQIIPAEASTKATLTGNLDANKTTALTSIEAYDSLGVKHVITVNYTKSTTVTNAWDTTYSVDNGTAAAGPTLTFNTSGKLSNAVNTDTDGDGTNDAYCSTYSFTPAGANAVAIVANFSAITQNALANSEVLAKPDGYAAGVLKSSSFDSNGNVVGNFSNGMTKTLAQIALATFANSSGLTNNGGTLFSVSSNSGSPIIGTAGQGSKGTLATGSVEMSNVNLAQEFSQMIMTQRGYQANSRIITTSDEMLQELVNLKR